MYKFVNRLSAFIFSALVVIRIWELSDYSFDFFLNKIIFTLKYELFDFG
jgi:hypothetical protein